jgi:glutaredoxin
MKERQRAFSDNEQPRMCEEKNPFGVGTIKKPLRTSTVRVYSTPGCAFCKRVKDFLIERNVEFEDINVAWNEEAKEMIAEKTGQLAVPVTQIGDEFVVGDDFKKIEELLKRHGSEL